MNNVSLDIKRIQKEIDTTDMALLFDGNTLKFNDLKKIVDGTMDFQLSEQSVKAISEAWNVVLTVIESGQAAYGITTMFGSDMNILLSPAEIKQFNEIIITQHATSLHDPQHTMPVQNVKRITRAAWIILLNSFAHGKSSVRLSLVKEIIERIKNDQVPYLNIDIRASIGAADLVPLAQMAKQILFDGFQLEAGEALALMSSNAVSLARAVYALDETKRFFMSAVLSVAFSYEGLRASLESFSHISIQSTSNRFKRDVSEMLRNLLQGSLLDNPSEPNKTLQPFLSLRNASDILALLYEALEIAEKSITDEINAHHGNPVVDIESRRILTTSNYDTSRVANALSNVVNAIGVIVQTSESRSHKQYHRVFSGLSSGLSSEHPINYDGICTRKLPYWLCILVRESMQHVMSCSMMPRLATNCGVAENIEDYNSLLPQIISSLEQLLPNAQRVICMESIIACCAIERRGLGEMDLPERMRRAFQAFYSTSPFRVGCEQHYSLDDAMQLYLDPNKNLIDEPTSMLE